MFFSPKNGLVCKETYGAVKKKMNNKKKITKTPKKTQKCKKGNFLGMDIFQSQVVMKAKRPRYMKDWQRQSSIPSLGSTSSDSDH